jgi:type VI secretion system protein ImpL
MTFFQKLSRLMWACLIAAAVWWIGPLIAIGVYRPLGWVVLRQCAVVLLLIWGCWPWLVMVWHRLGMGLRQVQSKPARPVQDGMASRFRDLDRQLKARWEKLARSPLATWMGRLFNHHRQLLPWYMVMGPEGAGKTSWIMQTLLPQRNGHDHDVDVNFWFTHDAVWVDTPGCWLTVKGMTEADQTTWSKLLKGIRKLRSTGTVANGIVLCLDIQSTLEFSLEQRKRFAENLRDRFMDTQERWFQVPRVYLLLTGLDKLPGSVEFLSRLDSQTWRQGIGFSIDKTRINSNSSADLNAYWLAAYENMEARIQDQLLHACAQLTHQSALDQLPFAQALASLRKPLMEVLQTALMSVNGDLHGELRGVWLGSVADCTSQDFITSQTAELDEIPSKQSLSLLWRPAQAQILMEQAGVGEAKPVGLKNRLMASMRSIVWSLIAIVLSLWLIFGFVAELNHLSQVEAQFAEGKRLANLHKLKERGSESPLLDVASQMRYSQLRVGDLGLSSVSPFFEHSRIQAVASQTYSRHLQKSFMPELHNLVQKTLQSQVRGGPGDIYQTLKIYLMLMLV